MIKILSLNGLMNDVLWNSLARFSSAGISFIITLILMTLLEVPEYGEFVVYFSLFSTIPFFLDLGLNTSFISLGSIIKIESASKLADYSSTFFSIKLLIVVAISIVAVGLLVFNQIGLTLFYTVMLGGILGLWESFLTLFKLEQQFKRLSVLLPLRNVMAFIGVITVYYSSISDTWNNYLLAVMIAPLIMSAVVYFQSFTFIKIVVNFSIVKRIAQSSIWITLFTVVTAIHARADIYMIKYFTTTGYLNRNELGIFSAAFSLLTVANLMTSTFSEALLPNFSRQTDHSYFQKFYQHLIKTIPFAVLGAIFLSITLYFTFMYGFNGKYLESTSLILFMIGGTLCNFYLHTINTIFYPLRSTYVVFLSILIIFIINIIGGFTLIPKYGAFGAAIMNFVAPFIGLLVAITFLNHLLNRNERAGV
jgi:O-antigen/teichoic acid export membrane protein